MRTHFYEQTSDGRYLQVRLDIPGVDAAKLQADSAIHTFCHLWEREYMEKFAASWGKTETGWYWRLSARIGEVLRGE